MILGIDLGTTNSAAAIWRDGAAVLVPNRLGQMLTPSAVSLDDNGELLVGLAARERQVTHPARTATLFKRSMGTARSFDLGGTAYTPEALSALVLRSLKADAEAWLGETVTEAVITVPAYFNDKQRNATRRAGELAGLKVERLLNEPTAAALAYGIHNLADESRFLVFDLGGGTFDVSVLEIFDGIIEVRASTGDNRLGGEDFNAVLIKRFEAEHGAALGTATGDPALAERLRDAAERARRTLTSADTATMRLVSNDMAYETTISGDDFAAAAAPLIERLRAPVLRALRDSDLRADALAEIVLVGGATRMPLVRRTVTRMFGRFPATTVNPDEAVAIGAAVQAGLKARDSALREVVLTDVCPYSLGVDTSERTAGGGMRRNIFAPIIERNTVIPASRAQSFFTVADGQRSVLFNIFQGESRDCTDNVHLGAIEVPVPPKKAGEVGLDCRFSYDINGLLEVDVAVHGSGETRQLVILDDRDSIDAAELDRRRAALAALKLPARDSHANRAALARAARCYEDSLGERRAWIGAQIAAFESVLDGQDPRAIDAARSELGAMLDSFEGESWL